MARERRILKFKEIKKKKPIDVSGDVAQKSPKKVHIFLKIVVKVVLGSCKTGLSPPVTLCKAILLWWFFLFYVLVFNFFCAVGALCMFSYF